MRILFAQSDNEIMEKPVCLSPIGKRGSSSADHQHLQEETSFFQVEIKIAALQ